MPPRRSRTPSPGLSRRELGALTAGGLGALGLPRVASAASEERKFLFVYCYGGWDYSYVFAPLFESDVVDVDPDSTTAEAHGVTYVDAEDRPAVRTFFESYGDRTCLLNGFEVPSVSHTRCSRLLFTGSARSGVDDFPSIVAAHSANDLALPHTVLSGPVYSGEYASQVVRVGEDDQLPRLLDGRALELSDLPVAPGEEGTDDLVREWLTQRAESFEADALPGRARRFGSAYSATHEKLRMLAEVGEGLDLSADTTTDQILNGVDLLANGLARCVLVQDLGLYSMSWDSHSANADQTYHYELLFTLLGEVMEELDSRTGPGGGLLSEEVTVVVLSEMGRDPRLNDAGGKHHWTYTSGMFVGAGVRGGQVVGGFDNNATGRGVVLETGEIHDGEGVALESGHVAATVLALADIDPTPWFPATPPIEAVLA